MQMGAAFANSVQLDTPFDIEQHSQDYAYLLQSTGDNGQDAAQPSVQSFSSFDVDPMEQSVAKVAPSNERVKFVAKNTASNSNAGGQFAKFNFSMAPGAPSCLTYDENGEGRSYSEQDLEGK